MNRLLSRLFLSILIGFALIVVVNRGFVIRQRNDVWGFQWGVGNILGVVLSFFTVVAFLIVFPGLYLWFGKTILVWTMIGYARQQIVKQIIPQFLNQLSEQIWSAKTNLETQGVFIRNIWDQWLQKFPWYTRVLLKMSMKRLPVLDSLQAQLASIDLQVYQSQHELQQDLQQRVSTYLQKPSGSHIGQKLVIINMLCLLVVWIVLYRVG